MKNSINHVCAIAVLVSAWSMAPVLADPAQTELGACYRAAIQSCLGDKEERLCVNTGVDGCDRDHAVSASKLDVGDRTTLRQMSLKRELPPPTATAISTEQVPLQSTLTR